MRQNFTNVRSSRYVRRKNEREFIVLLARAWLKSTTKKSKLFVESIDCI
jgi:hypothetical protein